MFVRRLHILFLTAFLAAPFAYAQDVATNTARLKDLVSLTGATPVQLVGYGIVVGLDRTGDRARGRRSAPYTVQSISNMLTRFGINVDPKLMSSRNAAAVMVTATLNPFYVPGIELDVTVAALGDARSLSGGVLLRTPLLDPIADEVYAIAQGPLSTGSAEASSFGSSVKVNHSNTGRIPGGAVIVNVPPVTLDGNQVGLALERPDFTNAQRIAEAINNEFPNAASVQHAGLVQVEVPSNVAGIPGLMASLQNLTIGVDVPAKVVMNERTGTIVAGGNVGISEVMITYGDLVVTTQRTPFVSQPNAFGEGETVAGAIGNATLEQQEARSVVLPANTNVNQLAAALNELGLTARDVISIFQSIARAGALQGELIIL